MRRAKANDLQGLTITAGHETLEASTDPRVEFVEKRGWSEVDDAHAAFEFVTEGELADLCEFASTSDWVSPPDMDYSIQRTWSNAAAAAGHDPCVGDPTTPYYQAIPDDPDVGTVDYEGFQQPTGGTKIAIGATGTVNLTVYSDTPTAGPFEVALFDLDGTPDAQGVDTSPVLSFVSRPGCTCREIASRCRRRWNSADPSRRRGGVRDRDGAGERRPDDDLVRVDRAVAVAVAQRLESRRDRRSLRATSVRATCRRPRACGCRRRAT